MAQQRRDKGAGSIYKDTSRGGWRGEVEIAGKRYVRRGKTKAQVVDRLNALKRDHARGVLAVDQATTVAALMQHYVERAVPNRRGGTLGPKQIEMYQWATQHLTVEVGTIRVAKLTTRDVERMLDRLADRGLSRSSITKVHGVLRRALDHAVRRGDLNRNVAAVAELPVNIKPEAVRLSLSEDMARRLLDGLDEYRNGAMFAVSLLLGLRPGEAAGLYWEDVDLDRQVLNVTRGRQAGPNGDVRIVDELKTTRAKRTVEMPDRLVELLAQHRRQQTEERLAAPIWTNPHLVFATRTGTPLDASAVRKQLKVICRDLGVTVDDPAGPRAPLPYELRHTAASLYAAAGVPHEQIADLYGLTTTRMIEDRYRHRLRPTVDVARVVDWSSTA